MYNGWDLLYKYGHIEVWKTPTKYLTCIKYETIFRFFDTLDESINEVKKLMQYK
jgi:hypothetical protein